MTRTPSKNANVIRPAFDKSGTLDKTKLADSFRELESDICDLVRAAQLADLLVAELEDGSPTMQELRLFATSQCEKAAIALKRRYYEQWESAKT
jgi:hypothetical protein